MNRGVDRRNIFLDDTDRKIFVHRMGVTTLAMGWRLFAFVLMSNHYHLVFETPESNLSRGMQQLESDYARIFNRRHDRAGALVQSRFKSEQIDSERYLLEAVRYTVLNPVRAGMVEEPSAWRWSSYRATAGLSSVPTWLDIQAILDRFDPNDWGRATSEYRAFVARSRPELDIPSRWKPGASKPMVDIDTMLNLVVESNGPLARGPRANGMPRQIVAAVAAELGATYKEIGARLEIGVGAVAKLVTAAREREVRDPAFAHACEEIRRKENIGV
jgi:REP element-mobilizing transposase RayT